MSKPLNRQSLSLSDLFPSRQSITWKDLHESSQIKFTYSGRSAIYQYLFALRKSLVRDPRDVVLLPAFHCPTVVDAVLHAGFKVKFFRIKENLAVDELDFLSKLDSNVAAVLLIRYFGIGEIPDVLLKSSRAVGAKVISDCSHSFLTNWPLGLAGRQADASVYSFWKILPMATVGGGIWCCDEKIISCWPEQSKVSLKARLNFTRKLLVEMKDNFFELLSNVENSSQRSSKKYTFEPVLRLPYEMAYPYDKWLASAGIFNLLYYILQKADLKKIAELRRQNFNEFCSQVSQCSHYKLVYPSLAELDVPWGVPLLIDRRYECDYLLRGLGMPIFSFGEVLHPLLFRAETLEPEMVSIASNLSKRLVGISVHQQLTKSLMSDYALTANIFFSNFR